MSKIQLLDCTLRDGGYINNFRFGKYAIRKILQQLTHAGLDIVECGFLEDGEYDEDTSIFQMPAFRTDNPVYSKISPSMEMVTTCQGRNFPLSCIAFFAAISSPPQQGTSMRTMVTD